MNSMIPRDLFLRRFAIAQLVASLAATAFAHELSPIPEKSWDREKAAHLLRRAGFGGTPQETEQFHALGLEAAVKSLVDYSGIPFAIAPPPFDPAIRESIDRPMLRALDEDERQKAIQERQRAERRGLEEMRLWWIERMIATPRPFEEKMTLLWHGHFTSGAREVRRTFFLYEQNEFLRRHALDNFRELLLGVSRDRAMLVYLDNANNVSRQPNENYARELLELFSLGVGNYSESDIKAAARSLTGWTFNDDGFFFRRRDHDFGPKTFLGRTGAWDGTDIIDIIIQNDACSRFLSRKLLTFFVTPDPDRRLIERFAAEIRRNKFELRPSMRALFMSEGFYDPEHRGALIKSPVELIVSTARQLGVPLSNLVAAERAMAAMGQELFQPPNVRGWPGGEQWINTATLYNRYNFVGGLIHGSGRPARQRSAAGNDEETRVLAEEDAKMMADSMQPMTRLRARVQPPYNPRSMLEAYNLTNADAVVDFYASHLLATPLSDAKREQLVRYLLADRPEFDPQARGAIDRVRTMVHLLCSTPEFQLH